MKFNLSVTKTSTAAAINTAIEKLETNQVYVGVPASANSRPGETITNAELMYIHTNGSPIRGIPARPVIEPAIQAQGNKEPIADELKQAAQMALIGDDAGMKAHLANAGSIGASAAKAWFTDSRNNWPPNKPSTIRRKLTSKSTLQGKALKAALAIVDAYELDSTTDVSGVDTPLIDTGELRRSITFVVG